MILSESVTVCLPELALWEAPPGDLLLRVCLLENFLQRVLLITLATNSEMVEP